MAKRNSQEMLDTPILHQRQKPGLLPLTQPKNLFFPGEIRVFKPSLYPEK